MDHKEDSKSNQNQNLVMETDDKTEKEEAIISDVFASSSSLAQQKEATESSANLQVQPSINNLDSDLHGDLKSGEKSVPADENEVEDVRSKKTKVEDDEQNEEMEICDEEILYNLTPEELILAQKTFGNHLTLGKILQNIPTNELWKFRLINKLFEEETTSLLMKNPEVPILLKYNSRKKCYYCYIYLDEPKTKRSLSQLNDCIVSSRRFPCGYFDIYNPVDLETDDMKEFLRLHGKEIKILKYGHREFREMKLVSLRNLLIRQAPNIRELRMKGQLEYIQSKEYENGEVPLFPQPEKPIFPNIISLHFGDFFTCQMEELILACPNLQKISGDVFRAVDPILKLRKIHIVKHIQITRIEKLYQLYMKKWAGVHSSLKLTSLSLIDPLNSSDFPHFFIGHPLSLILDSSKNTLTEMYLHVHENFFEGVQWPCFKNVTSLGIGDHQLGQQQGTLLFPPNFISNVFPNLTSLDIDALVQCESFNSFLVSDGGLRNVKKLRMAKGNAEFLNRMIIAAPNVEELTVHRIHEFHRVAEFIWAFSKVKKLLLHFWFGEHFRENSFPLLEMGFTGLSEEIVRRLHQDSIYFEEMKGQEINRERLSILNCTALESLTMNFKAPGHDTGIADAILFTHVSGEFAFKRLNKVETKILCGPGFENAVRPLFPHVDMILEEQDDIYTVYANTIDDDDDEDDEGEQENALENNNLDAVDNNNAN